MTKKAVNLAALFAGLLFVQAVIWVPELSHYRVSENFPSRAVVDRAVADQYDRLSNDIDSVDFSLVGELSDIQTILTADSVLGGTLRFPRNIHQEISWPFEEKHLHLGHSGLQLKMAGLAWAEVALDAWRLTGEDKYLEFAEENVLRFVQFESAQHLPTAYLWNDHAVANRALVYSQLWAALRSRGPVDRKTARYLLRAVDRTAKLLAKPSHYTYRTNHGLMQNVALLVIAAAFPWLEETESYKRIGFERLARQMNYFVSDQGAILEHSAGYHEFGVALMHSSFSLLESLSMSVPEAWQLKLDRAEKWLRVLSRPDLSVPNFGDSSAYLGEVGREIVTKSIVESRDVEGADDTLGLNGSFLMDAGYGVFRSRIEEATDIGVHATLSWSDFISGAHKHADELGIHYWSNGSSWWTSVGYWPYPDSRRDVAIGWAGSNAPHFVGEPAKSERSSRLVSFGDGGDHSIWVLRRQNSDGYSVLRQAILFRDEWALVVDSVEDQLSRPTEVMWGVPAEVSIDVGSDRSARLMDRVSGRVLGVGFDGTARYDLTYLHGSSEPFGGWMVDEGTVKEVGAIRIVSQADNALVTGWGMIGGGQTSAFGVRLRDWQREDRWSIELNVDGKQVDVERVESRLEISHGIAAPLVLELAEPTVNQALSTEVEAYRNEVSIAQTYADYFPWRLRASNYVLGLVLGLALLFFFWPETRLTRLASLIPAASLGGSLAFGAYLHFVYFAA